MPKKTISNFSSKFTKELIDKSINNYHTSIGNQRNFFLCKQAAYDGHVEAQHKLAEMYTDPSSELLAELSVLDPKYSTYIATIITHFKELAKKGDKLALLKHHKGSKMTKAR